MSAAVAPTIRRLTAPELKKTKAMPAAGATANGDSIDLGQDVLGPEADNIEVVVAHDACGSLADSKTITSTIQDSADNASFAALAGVPTVVSLGAGGVGDTAKSVRMKLPPGTRRYIRLSSTVQGSGGDNTASNSSITLYTNC
ncbi:Bbp16 family capsid cement protein [Prosthecobacter sp.]|uniref:Bbp16 family capsid cement protein n=1 Tax=Prosthecobacter sp. TaxID=1965333 RepID=UPI00378436DB